MSWKEFKEVQVPCLAFANPPAQAQREVCLRILSNTTEASHIFAVKGTCSSPKKNFPKWPISVCRYIYPSWSSVFFLWWAMTCNEFYWHVMTIHNILNSKQPEANCALRKAEVLDAWRLGLPNRSLPAWQKETSWPWPSSTSWRLLANLTHTQIHKTWKKIVWRLSLAVSHRSVSVIYASSWVHDDIVNFIDSNVISNVFSGSWDKTREFLWRGLCFHLLYRLLAPFGLATCQDHLADLAEVKRGMRGMRSCLFWRSKAAHGSSVWKICKHVINTW